MLLLLASMLGAPNKEIIFKLAQPGIKGLAAESVAASIATTADLTNVKRVFRSAGKFEKRHSDFGLDRWFVGEAKGRPEDSLQKLRSQTSFVQKPAIRNDVKMLGDARTNNTIVMYEAPNDPQYSSQPHYPAIGMESVWALDTGSPSVIVAVVDSGIDMTHQDLQRNQWVNEGEICDNGIDDDGNGYVDDCRGYNFADNTGTNLRGDGDHGTHVAGIVAADSDNGVGVTGVAGGSSSGKGALLMHLTVFGQTNTGGFEEAIVYGADMGAAISQNSWGYFSQGFVDQSVLDAIDYFNANGGGEVTDKGTVVFAAGNDNSNGDWYPARYEGTVAVASTTSTLERSWFSNYGPWVDVAAPGSDILSTFLDNQYGYMSGTSMACPFVSGLLALFMSYAPGKPKETYLNCLYSTARPLVDSGGQGWTETINGGIVDPYKAMTECLVAPPAAPPTPPKPPSPPSPPPPPPSPPAGPISSLMLSLTTDQYPTETTWTLSSDGEEVASGGPYSMSYTLHEHALQLADGTYTITLYDSYGDGFCCSWGDGSWSLSLNGGLLHQGDAAFATSTSFTFVVASDESGSEPPPPPSPSPSPINGTSAWWTIDVGASHCELTNDGRCVTDGSGAYGNGEFCKISAKKVLVATATEFAVENLHDHITISNKKYDGTVGPASVPMAAGESMTWSSDVSVTAAGWTICASDPGAAPPPQPSPPPPSPPPPSSPPPSSPQPVCENQRGDDWCGRKANTNRCNKAVFRNKCQLACIEFGHPCNAGTFAEMSLEASPAPEIEEEDATDEHEVGAAEDGGLGGLRTAALIGIVVGGVVFGCIMGVVAMKMMGKKATPAKVTGTSATVEELSQRLEEAHPC